MRKTTTLGCVYIVFESRNRSGMGRFGGGWNWKVGFQIGGNTIVIYFLIASLRITINRKEN